MSRKKSAPVSLCSSETTTSPEPLDFSSAEFNQIDDLDDNTGNYRAFHSLTGIVTADMRHHEQRRRMPAKIQEPTAERGAEMVQKSSAEDKAVLPNKLLPPLTIVSTGRLLIIDSHLERALICARRLRQEGITCTLCSPSPGRGNSSATTSDSFPLVETYSIAVSGTFGGFLPSFRTADGTMKNVSTLTGHQSSATGRSAAGFDLVLDLQTTPSFVGEQLPVGYYAPGADPLLLETILAELPRMRGRFKKPQFVLMVADRCLHGRAHLDGCRQCVDICPVAALCSENGLVVVDQYRCQGCGACALVCPSGAIQVPGPRRELLSGLGQLLGQSVSGAQIPTRVIFHDMSAQEMVPTTRAENCGRDLFFAVEEVGLIGPDVLLATLAHGAAAVALICDHRGAAAIREGLAGQMRLGAAIVKGLQLPAESLSFPARSDDLPDIPLRGKSPMAAPTDFTLDHDKRSLIRLAAARLHSQNGGRQPVIELPDGAPFGTIAVTASCSLCMACVSACPAGALLADGKRPRLVQIESRCLQCGACKATCPENCISLQPRLLCDPVAANAPRLVHEEEPFKCVVCGEPFASVSMVGKMQEKLAEHWMFSSTEQKRRLQMCRTCRTRDVFNTGDYQT